MRLALAAASLFLTSLAIAQGHKGTYKLADGTGVNWAISLNGGFIWNGKPFRPVGLRSEAGSDAIGQALAASVKDFIVDLPASGTGWAETITTLESKDVQYLVAVSSLAPSAPGFIVEPANYRINGITEKKFIDVKIPGARSALVVLAAKRDGSVNRTMRIKAVNERITAMLDTPAGIEHVALIYPETTDSGLVDYWEAFDEHRDTLLRTLKTYAGAKGLRGLLNPLGNASRHASDAFSIPNSPRFRIEFSAYLEQKYRNLETAMRIWSMSAAELTGFDNLARLVPLWNGSRGVGRLWDPQTDALYPCEQGRSQYWLDVRTVLARAEHQRYQALASGLKKACNVPVFQEWRGWSPWYEARSSLLDGIGARIVDAPPFGPLETAGRAASSHLRSADPGWLFAAAYEFEKPDLQAEAIEAINGLEAMGFSGTFFRADTPAQVAAVAQEVQRRAQLATSNPTAARPLYFPEGVANPAGIQRLAGGRYWLPAPYGGARVDLGGLFNGYRMDSPNGEIVVLWASSPTQNVKLRVSDPKSVVVTSIDGNLVQTRIHRNGIEVDFGLTPLVFSGSEQVPVPEPALADTLKRFEELVKKGTSLRMDLSEEAFLFTDANRAMDRTPGAAFIRMNEILDRINGRLAPYMWIEAENFKESTFSEVQLVSGLSNASALFLKGSVLGMNSEYSATYQFPVRSGQELEVWMSARIPREFRGDMNLIIGNQLLKIAEQPMSAYGNGFGWYKLGTTRFAGNQATVQVRVNPNIGTELAIDSLVFYPGAFRPNGIEQPSALSLLGASVP